MINKLSVFADKDLDRQILEITSKLNANGFIALPLSNGVTNAVHELFGAVVSQNGIVHLYGFLIIPSDFVMQSVIATLPAGLRPARNIVRTVYCDNSIVPGGTGSIYIDTSGYISITDCSAPGQMGIDISWIAKS